MERRKFLEAGRYLHKFEGLGPAGCEALGRARTLAKAGFGPDCEPAGNGYVRYSLLSGRCGRLRDISEGFLNHMARYCAFRAFEFRTQNTGPDLNHMLQCNFAEEFGKAPLDAVEPAKSATMVDGRMLPHEWLLTPDGWRKTDGVSHGDDHFYPGPTDIAWDLAGAIVEWRLGPQSTDYLLRRYKSVSGDDASDRLPGYTTAYVAFRMGYCKMAMESVADPEEQNRLRRDFSYYRSLAQSFLPLEQAA